MRPEDQLVVPVLREELTVDAIPVQTGSVRVVKHVDSRDEVFEQELRKGRVEIKRIKTNRVVDGPQPVERSGNKLVIPVVSEILKIEKQWVVTEEIHLTQFEERETFKQAVPVSEERAVVERLDADGNVANEGASDYAEPEARRRAAAAPTGVHDQEPRRRVLSSSDTSTLLRNRDKQK